MHIQDKEIENDAEENRYYCMLKTNLKLIQGRFSNFVRDTVSDYCIEYFGRSPNIKGLATQPQAFTLQFLCLIFKTVSRMVADAKCTAGHPISLTHLSKLCVPLALCLRFRLTD